MSESSGFDFGRFAPGGGGGRGRRGGGGGGGPVAPLGRLFDREPPYSLEAEMSLLGSMILDPNVIGDVLPVVRGPEYFHDQRHAWVYRAVVDVFDRTASGDLVQIQEWLRREGVYDEVGEQRLVDLANAVPTPGNAVYYARIVAEKYKLRRLIDAAGRVLYDAYHVGNLGPEGAAEVINNAEQLVFEIAQEEMSSEPQDLKSLLQREMDRLESQDGSISGLGTGFYQLDETLRGLQEAEMIVIAARPSMGKTALALNLAEQIALGGTEVVRGDKPRVPVAVFSLEMSKTAVVQRLISARSGISSQDLRTGGGVDFKRIVAACAELDQAPIFVDDMANMTMQMLRTRARRLVAQHGVRCLMIDYLQLLASPQHARESRQVEVSAISRGIKGLARELNVPVVCLAQLNRAAEQRTGNRPRMSDLRESGSIEQDADVIILLHREEYYHLDDPTWADENPDKVGVAELIVAKQRNGPTGVVKLKWDHGSTRFKNLDSHAHEPAGYRPDPPSSPPRSSGQTHTGAGDAPFHGGTYHSGFHPGKKTGPVADHRDGGGPDRRADDTFDEDFPA